MKVSFLSFTFFALFDAALLAFGDDVDVRSSLASSDKYVSLPILRPSDEPNGSVDLSIDENIGVSRVGDVDSRRLKRSRKGRKSSKSSIDVVDIDLPTDAPTGVPPIDVPTDVPPIDEPTGVCEPGDGIDKFGESYNVCNNTQLFAVPTVQTNRYYGAPCRSTSDCDSLGGGYCQLLEDDRFPPKDICYQCVVDSQCNQGEFCELSTTGASCATNGASIELPSMRLVEQGYNIFKGDPFFSFGVPRDPGTENNIFYKLTWEESTEKRVTLNGADYYAPLEFEAFPSNLKLLEAGTSVITTSESLIESQSTAVKVGATGTVQGVDLGGGVGTGTFRRTAKDASDSVTTTTSDSYNTLYRFTLPNNYKASQFTLSDSADNDLRNLVNWSDFFEAYGTHLTTSGYIGASERVSFKFTESERSSLAQESDSFEQSLSIGIPGVFGFDQSSATAKDKEIGAKIIRMNSETRSVTVGDPDDLFAVPGIIIRELDPICQFIDYTVYTGITRDDCYNGLRSYCVSEMNKEALLAEPPAEMVKTCKYPKEFKFECFRDEECQRLPSGQCIKGRCVSRPGRENPDDHGCKLRSREKWIGCSVSPKCPSGYKFLRNEGSVCFLSTRIVCRKEWFEPPCRQPLKGTCGRGNRGNGCCPGRPGHKDGCSKYGWCFNGPDWKTAVEPSFAQCDGMESRS